MVNRAAIGLIGVSGVFLFFVWFLNGYAWTKQIGVFGTPLNLFFVSVLIVIALITLGAVRLLSKGTE